MKALVKVILIIGLCFAATFLAIKATGALTVEQIDGWLTQARQLSPLYVGALVAALLLADLFIAMPTLTVTILAGFFLGHAYGATAALAGLMLAGVCGYVVGWRFGEPVLAFLVKDAAERESAKTLFRQRGFVMILLARAVPILPEVTACLAGMTGMPFRRFILAWSLSSAPYALIAAYAGSVSSLENPQPAILAAIGISGVLWTGWYVFRRRGPNRQVA
jgi:uncharacterized membrane protein YdjX (TVP38/TMEM64 family)